MSEQPNNNVRIIAEADLEAMELRLVVGERSNTYNLNVKEPGQYRGSFNYYVGDDERVTEFHFILDLMNRDGTPISTPTLDVYPKYGENAVFPDPVTVQLKGGIEAYKANHKHYNQ